MYQMPAMAQIRAIATERGCETNLITVPLEEGRDNFSLEMSIPKIGLQKSK